MSNMNKIRGLTGHVISNLRTHEINTKAKRDLILSILKSTTTKREAKNYLTKYQGQFSFKNSDFGGAEEDNELLDRDAQRGLFIDRFLKGKNPFLSIYDEETKVRKIPLRIAIFRIKFLSILKSQWKGIEETFKRLIALGISPIIILDFDHLPSGNFRYNEQYMFKNAYRVMGHLCQKSAADGPDIKVTSIRCLFSSNGRKKDVEINNLELILIPLYQGIVPVIQPMCYDTETSTERIIGSNLLTKNLCLSLLETSGLLTIEKIVMVDPIGGIPSIERNNTSHVYINLAQEYSDIVSELYIGFLEPSVRDSHLNNFETMNQILSYIVKKTGNNDATGIITTPKIMSISSDQLNPIIYNVLTDRPIISSSLPLQRQRTPELSTSIIKKGIDVKIIDPDDYAREFKFSNLVEDGLVDKDRLVALIDDSFGKKLQADEYFQRIEKSLACIIIAGDYDGAAIITWEKAKSSDQKVAYLDKFAISTANQGLPGLADVIFKAMLQSFPNELIWRSRKNNPVNRWYFERSLGSMGIPHSRWKLFYTGDIFDKTSYKLPDSLRSSRLDFKRKIDEYMGIIEGIPASFSK